MLAHHPEKGGFKVSGMYIQYGLGGAILLDMSLEELIDITDKRLILKSTRLSGDPLIHEVIKLMSQNPQPRRVGYWVRKLAEHYNRYKWQILKGFADKRIVRVEEKKFLGLIPYRRSYLIESYTRSNLIRQLKNEILTNSREPSSSTLAIAGLIEACRMHRILSDDRDELKIIRTRLKKIGKEAPVSDVVSQTVRQVQTAILASVTAAMVASTAGGSH